MASVRKCEKCSAFADVTRDGHHMTVSCPKCGYKSYKVVIKKGPGG